MRISTRRSGCRQLIASWFQSPLQAALRQPVVVFIRADAVRMRRDREADVKLVDDLPFLREHFGDMMDFRNAFGLQHVLIKRKERVGREREVETRRIEDLRDEGGHRFIIQEQFARVRGDESGNDFREAIDFPFRLLVVREGDNHGLRERFLFPESLPAFFKKAPAVHLVAIGEEKKRALFAEKLRGLPLKFLFRLRISLKALLIVDQAFAGVRHAPENLEAFRQPPHFLFKVVLKADGERMRRHGAGGDLDPGLCREHPAELEKQVLREDDLAVVIKGVVFLFLPLCPVRIGLLFGLPELFLHRA